MTASLARRARVDILWRSLGSRPIGSSIRRPACTTPHTSATYSFSTSRSWNCRESSWCARSFFATTMTPDVPRSSRCTIPGLSSPPMPLRVLHMVKQRVDQRSTVVPRRRVDDHACRLVQHDQVGILVKDPQRKRLRAPAWLPPGPGHLDREGLPGPNGCARAGPPGALGASESALNLPVLDQPLNPRPGQVGHQGGRGRCRDAGPSCSGSTVTRRDSVIFSQGSRGPTAASRRSGSARGRCRLRRRPAREHDEHDDAQRDDQERNEL